jgi:hypothetical protein
MKRFFSHDQYCLIIVLLFISLSSLAQSGPPSPPDGGGGPGSVNDVPINMYLVIMLIFGAFYGIKKNFRS